MRNVLVGGLRGKGLVDSADGELTRWTDAAPTQTMHEMEREDGQETLITIVARQIVADHPHARLVETEN